MLNLLFCPSITWYIFPVLSFQQKSTIANFVATRGKIFSLKFTKYRLAAGLRPDPLGDGPAGGAKALPQTPSRNKGGLLLRGGKGMEGEGEERGGGGERGRGGTCSKVLGGGQTPLTMNEPMRVVPCDLPQQLQDGGRSGHIDFRKIVYSYIFSRPSVVCL